MINCIIVGRGNRRKAIEMVRDRNQRRSVAGAIKGFLFPTAEAHHKAMAKGKRRAAKYHAQQRQQQSNLRAVAA